MKHTLLPENLYKSGIYIITNTINSRMYIGSTKKFIDRFHQHCSDIKKLKHNKRLLNFVKKYGIDKLIFSVLEIVEGNKLLLEREQYWMDYYQSYNSKIGFNICLKAGSIRGIKMPESQKAACRKRMIGNTLTKGMKFSKEKGEKMRQYYIDNPEALEKMKENNRIAQLKVDRTKFKKGKIIEVYYKNELIDTVEGLKEVCKKYKLTHSSASKTLQGKQKETKGYKLISKGFYFYTE